MSLKRSYLNSSTHVNSLRGILRCYSYCSVSPKIYKSISSSALHTGMTCYTSKYNTFVDIGEYCYTTLRHAVYNKLLVCCIWQTFPYLTQSLLQNSQREYKHYDDDRTMERLTLCEIKDVFKEGTDRNVLPDGCGNVIRRIVKLLKVIERKYGLNIFRIWNF